MMFSPSWYSISDLRRKISWSVVVIVVVVVDVLDYLYLQDLFFFSFQFDAMNRPSLVHAATRVPPSTIAAEKIAANLIVRRRRRRRGGGCQLKLVFFNFLFYFISVGWGWDVGNICSGFLLGGGCYWVPKKLGRRGRNFGTWGVWVANVCMYSM